MKMRISISIQVDPDVNLPGGIALEGIHFRARRSGNGQNADRHRRESGSDDRRGASRDCLEANLRSLADVPFVVGFPG
ncbi:MAG: hypothetical protein WCK55_17870, partial [Verrucomicrobiota bacterium]